MTNHVLGLIFILLLSACRPLPGRQAVGSEELAPYYKGPEPARIVISDKTYNSRIGNTKWIKLTKDGTRYMEFADAFATITPTEPLVLPSNPSFTLKLPIPIYPAVLWYSLFKVPEQELVSQVPSHGSFRWNPDHKTQTYQKQTDLALLSEQERHARFWSSG